MHADDREPMHRNHYENHRSHDAEPRPFTKVGGVIEPR